MVKIEVLQERFERNEIQGVLLDFDDTLLSSREEFIRMMRLFAEAVASGIPGISADEVYDLLRELNNRSYDKFAIRRSRWKLTVEDMKGHFEEQYHKVLDDAFRYLAGIYTTPIDLSPGAMEVVQTLSRLNGIFLGLVTHAEEEWTYQKIAWAGLEEFFTPENVFIVDENVHKGPEHWKGAAERFSLDPQGTLMIGDNLKGDVIAAHRAGIGHKVWIKLPNSWSKYSEGEVPEGTHIISSISELPNKLLEVL